MSLNRLRNLVFMLAFLLVSGQILSAPRQSVELGGHVPRAQMRDSGLLGPMDGAEDLDLMFGLSLRHQEELEQLIKDQQDPSSPRFGHFITPSEFTEAFGPSKEEVNAVTEHLKKAGFKIINTSSNRVLIRARASVSSVQKTLNIRMNRYKARNRSFFAAAEEPSLPPEVAQRVVHITGLQNAQIRKPHLRRVAPRTALQPAISGTGPRGGLSPQDIATAYNLPGGSANGQGQTLALFQMDGFLASDIEAYTKYFNLSPVPLETILVDGFDGSAGTGAVEVCMDIEMMNAIAPGASRILVYEGPNTDQGVLDVYSRIANDNRASSISSSWGLSEYDTGPSYARLEAQFFMQMAVQGQSFYAASGDAGAYDAQSPSGTPVLTVDDPAGQPYVTGVGGTRLNLSSGQSYGSEVVWNSNGGASGGGVSSIWTLPSWQASVANVASKLMRNVPDVALNADPNTGFAIYTSGQWQVIAGTSAAAPLWAGFTAIVNQKRKENGLQALGFANPTIYSMGNDVSYGTHFHDVNVGNNNYYTAELGYDNATGWGSFQGSNLLAALSQGAQTVTFSNLPASMVWGSTVNLSGAAAASSGLPVSYTVGPSETCTISGTILLGQYPGNCVIHAIQSGSSQYAPATASATIQVVEPSYPGVNKSLKVTVRTPGGKVTSSPYGIACGDEGAYCLQSFTRNTVVTLTATPGTENRFLGWSGACSGKALTCRFKITSNRVVTARFK
jgi:subtilase family serine protease